MSNQPQAMAAAAVPLLLIDRQVTAEAQSRATRTTEAQLAEAVDLAAAWYETAAAHGIDHDALGWCGSLTSTALDAVKLRDDREARQRQRMTCAATHQETP
jgi:hypothetical protein